MAPFDNAHTHGTPAAGGNLPRTLPPARGPAPSQDGSRAALSSTPAADTVSFKTWLAVLGSVLGAFMAVLNIQIVNASLADIQGGIGAGVDDGGWIATAYLIGEIIVIPLSGFLSQVFSVRRYLITNTVLFLVFSVACAFAQNLQQMIVLRAIQGFCGGVLIPMAFTLIITLLPKSRHPLGLALFALTATFAPAIGPTIGGYLTETYGWKYIFYINLVPGVFMVAALWASLERAPLRLGLLRQGDWWGIATMAVGLASLQTVLEEGNKDDWFGSAYIMRLALIAAVALGAFLVIELKVDKPLLNLRLLARRNFGLGIVANALLGVVLYASSYLLPRYLGQIQGYNAQQIGSVMAWVGLPQLVLIPLVPMLMKRFDARWLALVGAAIFAGSNFMNIHLWLGSAADQLFWPNIVRAFGQALVMTPLSVVATGGIEKENAGSASGLFNMMRNLGGAVGIALTQTWLTKREQFHSNVMTGQVSLFGESTRQHLAMLQQKFMDHGVPDAFTAWRQAVAEVDAGIRAQAWLMAYSDAFFFLGSAMALSAVAILFLKKAAAGADAGGAH
ncbi:MDR family MFS transporter [Nitrospirillum pindoramense]|uniref:DHA2 family multidrug resistance protein n=1 Tax=Nitrospirillum amazonense TaxID=28077 RepID=A0A560HAF3_9PROT|nr:MDR family MFS transporter [Nitrospirillum amazonense]TWB43298.1 DHA2 family multidrug resistance protein [Nitrospirillum amazonense]